jgi:general stress protein YciG
VSQDRAHMAAIGRKGGEARGSKRGKKPAASSPESSKMTPGAIRS